MIGTPDDAVVQRLAALGLILPRPSKPIGLYRPFRLDRGTGYLSGHWPLRDGMPVHLGRVGAELTLEEGRAAARLTALGVLSSIREALSDFGPLRGLLRVDGYVASAADFQRQPEVLDAASELFIQALGERGQHARTSFAPARLPTNHSIKLVVTFSYDE
jgi:hypothetical protein